MQVNPLDDREFLSKAEEKEDGEHSDSGSDSGSDDESTDSVKILHIKLTPEEEFEQDLAALRSNPAFGSYIKSIVAEELAEERKGLSKADPTVANKIRRQDKAGTSVAKEVMPKQKGMERVKSPSDTTLYVPALRQIMEQELILPVGGNISQGHAINPNTKGGNQLQCLHWMEMLALLITVAVVRKMVLMLPI